VTGSVTSEETGERQEPAPDPPPRRWHWLTVPLAVWAASRLVQLVVLNLMLAPGSTMYDRLLSWDGGWFVRVARDGYPTGYTFDNQGQVGGSELAFFPLYPMLVRTARFVLPMDFGGASLVVAGLAGIAAVVAVYALGAALYDRRVALALAVLFSTQPMSVVLSMGYTEGLFTALAAGALLFAYRQRWLLAGALGLAASLTRPTGAAVAVAVAAAAALALRDPAGRGWRVAVGGSVPLLGVPGYLWWVGHRVGESDAWFRIQTAGWGTTFDFGANSWRFVTASLQRGDGFVQVACAWLLIGAVVAAVVALVDRAWPPLWIYGLLSLGLVVGQAGFYHSKPRLLVPVLLVLLPLATAIGRSRPRAAALLLVGWAAIGLWFGAYMITVWRFAI
jgi:4-amino-4-deoxy-L-arabinose transferase-like glycosyltransferase